MQVIFVVNKSATADPAWSEHLADWYECERVPGKGELVQVGEYRMRVFEICQTGPSTVSVLLVPTYVDFPE